MSPLDLSQDLDLGHPSRIAVHQVEEAERAAADTVAWRLCELAGRRGTIPMIAYLQHAEESASALLEARRRVYQKLLADSREWIRSFPEGTPEYAAAQAHARTFLERHDSFDARASERISAVLSAATATPPTLAPSSHAAPAGPTVAEVFAWAAADADADQSRQEAYAESDRALGDVLRRLALRVWIYGIVCLAAILLSVATISSASSYGGTGVLAWGAVVFGAIYCVRNTVRHSEASAQRLRLRQQYQRDMATRRGS